MTASRFFNTEPVVQAGVISIDASVSGFPSSLIMVSHGFSVFVRVAL